MQVDESVDGFIIGAQKAGSTSLDRFLASHPEVLAARYEVPTLEDPDYQAGGTAEVRQWVRSNRPTPATKVVLRRPNYLCDPLVPERMRLEWPAIRLITVLRDPVNRALSAYFHYMRYGLIAVEPAETGLLKLLHGDLDPRWPRAAEVLELGLYGSALSRWLGSFPARHLAVIDSDGLRTEPIQTLAFVARHLGIDPSISPPPMRDGMPGSYGMSHVRVRSRLQKVLYARSTNHRLSPRWVLPQLYDRTERLLWPDHTSPPSLSEKLRDSLREYYRPDVLTLRQLISPTQVPAWTECYR